jgi:alpha-L-fucosidase
MDDLMNLRRREFFQLGAGAIAAASAPAVPLILRAESAAARTSSSLKTPRPAPRLGDGRDWWFEKRIGKWYRRVKESLVGAAPASHLTSNRGVLLTMAGNNLYVHLNSDPVSETVKLKPLAMVPRKATLLNTGKPVDWSLEMVPSEHVEQGRYLRLRKLLVNETSNTVLVVKLEG